MLYYRSTAQRISQGFQKVHICYFTTFLWITMHFQNSSRNLHKEKIKENTFASGTLDFLEINRSPDALFIWVLTSHLEPWGLLYLKPRSSVFHLGANREEIQTAATLAMANHGRGGHHGGAATTSEAKATPNSRAATLACPSSAQWRQ